VIIVSRSEASKPLVTFPSLNGLTLIIDSRNRQVFGYTGFLPGFLANMEYERSG